MNSKKCIRCSTENEENFTYCRYCGAPLPVVDRMFPQDMPPFAEDNKASSHAKPDLPETIFGTSKRQLGIFIGKNDIKFLKKLRSMELRNQNSSWSACVFVLGLLFGFFGISAWFFYRKMYKWGVLTCILGALSLICPVFFTSAYELQLLTDSLILYLSAALTQSVNFIFAIFYQPAYFPAIDISYLISCVAAPVIFAVFAMSIYKNKAVKAINRVNSSCYEPELLDIRIASEGGVSALSAVIPVIVALLSLCIAAIILTI